MMYVKHIYCILCLAWNQQIVHVSFVCEVFMPEQEAFHSYEVCKAWSCV